MKVAVVTGLFAKRDVDVNSESPTCRPQGDRIHVYIAANLHIWDIAAAIIILEELGGTHNFIDKELAYNSDGFFFIAANNKEVQEEILEKYFN